VLVNVLEGLHESERFINITANWKIINGYLPDNLVRIDDEKTSKSDSLVLKKNTVISRDRFGQIRDKRNVHLSETTLFSWRLGPSKMGKVRIDRCSYNFSADLSELINSIAEGDDFSWADEGKIEGVKEEYEVLSLVVG